jgi:threonine dehydrogenase-like Zn-dependent dehydrogenase
MKALVYDIRPAGWLACKLLGPFWKGCVGSCLGGLSLRDVPAPALPGDDWVRLRTLIGGICGTDLAIIAQKQPPDSILQAFSSMPILLGHEGVAVVEEVGPAVDRSWLGRRVCVEPTLGCTARGITPLCGRCEAGEFGACENFGAAGAGKYKLPAGTSIGYNNATGGALGERFVAHESQLVPLDDRISDELAVLTDPLACSMHAVLRAEILRGTGVPPVSSSAGPGRTPGQTHGRDAHATEDRGQDVHAADKVLVYGAGVLGLGIVACLRAIGFGGQIDVVGRSGQLESLAGKFGASGFLRLPPQVAGRFEMVAQRTGGTIHRARFGNLMLCGGYDVVWDCVGSGRSLEECLKWTRARGRTMLVATGTGRGADLTSVWFRELNVHGVYGRQLEHFAGRRIGTYQLVHELMLAGKLQAGELLTHKFPIGRYKEAAAAALDKAKSRAIKVAIDFRQND